MKGIIIWLTAIWQKLGKKEEYTFEDWQRLEFRDRKPTHTRGHE